MSEEHAHKHPNYIKIFYWLLVLLVISVVGPELGIGWLTFITAFGIAAVKAYMVCAYYMHLKFEKKIIWFMFGASLIFMSLFIAGTAGDIMNSEGHNWVNHAKFVVQEAKEADPGH